MEITLFDDNFIKINRRKKRRDITNLRQKALRDVSYEFYKKLYKMKLVLEKSNKFISKETFEEFVEVSTKFRQINNHYHQFITISLPPVFKDNLDQLKEKMAKLVKWKWIGIYTWSVEQRGTSLETLGEGLHIHLLNKPKAKKRPSHIIREVSQLFKIKKNFVDVDTKNDLEIYNTRQAYIRGNKVDTKLDKVKMDYLFRKNKNLCNVYTNAT